MATRAMMRAQYVCSGCVGGTPRFTRLPTFLNGRAYTSRRSAFLTSTPSMTPSAFAHYGLAVQYYTHFTSPIRRYADILVHRCARANSFVGSGGVFAQRSAHAGSCLPRWPLVFARRIRSLLGVPCPLLVRRRRALCCRSPLRRLCSRCCRAGMCHARPVLLTRMQQEQLSVILL